MTKTITVTKTTTTYTYTPVPSPTKPPTSIAAPPTLCSKPLAAQSAKRVARIRSRSVDSDPQCEDGAANPGSKTVA